MHDVRLVALAGSPHRTLRGVAALCEPGPEVVGVERDPELAADEVRHAAGRPEVGREPVGGRFLSQPAADVLVLVGGEEPRPTGRGFGGQPGLALGPVPGHPRGNGDGMNAQGDRHGRLRLAMQNPLHRPAANSFQSGSRSFASHVPEVTKCEATINSFTYLRISRSGFKEDVYGPRTKNAKRNGEILLRPRHPTNVCRH